MESKKSIQLSQAFGAVLTLVLVAVLIIVAIVIFVNLEDSFEGIQTTSVINESVTLDAVTGLGTVVGAAECGFTVITTPTIINTSIFAEGAGTNTLTLTTDYTVDTSTGIITNVTEWNTSLVTYSYTWGSGACDASVDMTTEFGNYTSLIGLVGTIIFLGLVIGVLVASFAFGGRKEV